MASIKRGEVWWVAFGKNEGGEIAKTRPAIIVSNDHANAVLNRVIVVPLTSHAEELYPGECFVNVQGRKGKAVTDQIRAISKSRLKGLLGPLESGDLTNVEKAILVQIGIDPNVEDQ
jgi:mRNA interferase MazF